ncbi:MAG: tetratricopeptide repeat protein [Candidatus Acidiferrum sp.]
MFTGSRLGFSALLIFAACASLLPAQASQDQNLDREFQAAVAQYDSGHYAEAATKLESLVHQLPENFEVQELLGLVYSAQSKDASANPHLEKAARLQPNSAPARTNLAANLVRLGKLERAGEEFKKAAELDPKSYDTNHNLAEYYIQSKKIENAVPYLERAQQLQPASYDNGYDLSLAYLSIGRFAEARQEIQVLLKQKGAPELHNLLGAVEEKDGKFVQAANEYELAARADPSESNLFDWGSELLIHRTLGPAIEVFQDAVKRYPASPRLAIGLGMALYAHGNYDDAVKSLLRAADLNPSDPSCYLFLSRAYYSSPSQADEVVQRFRRFSELQPRNARALYYYAMSLWKGKRAEDPTLDLGQIEKLLESSINLDPKLADAHLQLGNLFSDQHKYAGAIPEYLRALELDPNLADAHYRLGQAYVRTGQKEAAQEQLQVYQKMNEQHLADIERQRAEIRQFVYAEKDNPLGKP